MASNAIQSRGRVMASLTVIRKFVQSVNQNTTCTDIEVRLNKLDGLWNEFHTYEDQVAIAASKNPTANIELKQEEFETSFFETKSTLLDLLRKVQPKVTVESNNTSSFDKLLDQQRVFLESLADRTQAINERSMIQSDARKLPKVNLEKFSGEYEALPSFCDLYTSSIHNMDSISNVHKFQILKGLLTGPALHIIRNFIVTDSNYLEAWDKLVKRYDKKRPILNSHIERFFSQPHALNGSTQLLRQLSDVSDEIIRGIKALGDNAETRDPWLIRILLTKVDEDTRVAWANATLDQEFPVIGDFLEFLNNRCYAKESALCVTTTKVTKISNVVVKTMQVASNIEGCPCCKRSHYLRNCFKFKRMSVQQRRVAVNSYEVCYNCLRKGHIVSDCPAEYSCRICNLRHNTVLHIGTSDSISKQIASAGSVDRTKDSKNKEQMANSGTSSNVATTASNAITLSLALLPTALVYIRDSSGKNQLARALLDCGSQSSFISECLVQRLNLDRASSNIKVSGISANSSLTTGIVKITIQSRFTNNECFDIKALILRKLTSSIPNSQVDATCIEELYDSNLQLADPAFNSPKKIDLLLGADIFFDILKENKIKIQNQLIAQSTKFGWIVSGTIIERKIDINSYSAIVLEDNISKSLEKFWKLEEVPASAVMTESESSCESHFRENHKWNSDGRYVVKLPFKKVSAELGCSKSSSVSRLIAMELKIQRYSKNIRNLWMSISN